MAVNLVTATHQVQHWRIIRILPARLHLLPTATPPLLHAGVEIELKVGVGQDDSADVTSHHHYPPIRRYPSLLRDERPPHTGVRGDG